MRLAAIAHGSGTPQSLSTTFPAAICESFQIACLGIWDASLTGDSTGFGRSRLFALELSILPTVLHSQNENHWTFWVKELAVHFLDV